MAGKQYSFRLKEGAIAALAEIRTLPGFEFVDSDNQAVNMALMKYASLAKDSISKEDIDRVMSFIGTVPGAVRSSGRPVTKEPEAPKLSKEEQMLEKGRKMCELVEGTVEGQTCRFKKHELTAGDYTETYDVALPLPQMTQEIVDGQYFPDRPTFEKAKADGK